MAGLKKSTEGKSNIVIIKASIDHDASGIKDTVTEEEVCFTLFHNCKIVTSGDSACCACGGGMYLDVDELEKHLISESVSFVFDWCLFSVFQNEEGWEARYYYQLFKLRNVDKDKEPETGSPSKVPEDKV